jgi:hypothetical protein
VPVARGSDSVKDPAPERAPPSPSPLLVSSGTVGSVGAGMRVVGVGTPGSPGRSGTPTFGRSPVGNDTGSPSLGKPTVGSVRLGRPMLVMPLIGRPGSGTGRPVGTPVEIGPPGSGSLEALAGAG